MQFQAPPVKHTQRHIKEETIGYCDGGGPQWFHNDFVPSHQGYSSVPPPGYTYPGRPASQYNTHYQNTMSMGPPDHRAETSGFSVWPAVVMCFLVCAMAGSGSGNRNGQGGGDLLGVLLVVGGLLFCMVPKWSTHPQSDPDSDSDCDPNYDSDSDCDPQYVPQGTPKFWVAMSYGNN